MASRAWWLGVHSPAFSAFASGILAYLRTLIDPALSCSRRCRRGKETQNSQTAGRVGYVEHPNLHLGRAVHRKLSAERWRKMLPGQRGSQRSRDWTFLYLIGTSVFSQQTGTQISRRRGGDRGSPSSYFVPVPLWHELRWGTNRASPTFAAQLVVPESLAFKLESSFFDQAAPGLDVSTVCVGSGGLPPWSREYGRRRWWVPSCRETLPWHRGPRRQLSSLPKRPSHSASLYPHGAEMASETGAESSPSAADTLTGGPTIGLHLIRLNLSHRRGRK